MWEILKLNWLNSDVLTKLVFNRVEKNTDYLRILLG